MLSRQVRSKPLFPAGNMPAATTATDDVVSSSNHRDARGKVLRLNDHGEGGHVADCLGRVLLRRQHRHRQPHPKLADFRLLFRGEQLW